MNPTNRYAVTITETETVEKLFHVKASSEDAAKEVAREINEEGGHDLIDIDVTTTASCVEIWRAFKGWSSDELVAYRLSEDLLVDIERSAFELPAGTVVQRILRGEYDEHNHEFLAPVKTMPTWAREWLSREGLHQQYCSVQDPPRWVLEADPGKKSNEV